MSGAPVVLVVGVGRSGTSLAMQALRRLGARVSDRLVPTSPQNRHGALEDLGVRDEMAALGAHLHLSTGPRPDDWREAAATRQAEGWLAEHLACVHEAAETAYAVKFPLASLFLPIWRDAAARAGVPLRLVWATRRAEAVVASFGLAYGTTPGLAAAHHAQRTFYLLQDAPGDTLLLPYEGWRTAPAEQLCALAEAAGLPPPEAGDPPHDVYRPEDDRSGGDEAARVDVPPALEAADDALAERLGTLGEVVDEAGRRALLAGLGELLMRDDEADEAGGATLAAPPGEGPADPPAGEADPATILRRERDRLRQTVLELRQRRDALRERHEARLAGLRRDYEALSLERDLADARLADLASRHAIALGVVEQRLRKARADLEASRARYRKLDRKLRKQGADGRSLEAMQAELNRSKAGLAERTALAEGLRAELAQARARLAKRTALVERMTGSARWRMGDALAEAVQRPGRRTLALPLRLVRIWRGREP